MTPQGVRRTETPNNTKCGAKTLDIAGHSANKIQIA